MTDYTPKQIVAELDKYIVGQTPAKRAVAVAVRNRWRRQQLSPDVARHIPPRNIMMIGPTGVGKTEIARRLADLTGAPFIKVEATKFTEVGYHGRDVESMIRDLLDVSIQLVSRELESSVADQASSSAEEQILDLLIPRSYYETDPEAIERRTRTRETMRLQLRSGELDAQEVEITTEKQANVGSLLGAAAGDLTFEMQSMFEKMLPSQKQTRRMSIAEARQHLSGQHSGKMLDNDKVHALAIERCEQHGIIFLDEIDKIAASGKSDGPDVSRQGVQRDLLPIVEGSTVTTKHGPVRTDHILFIAAGAFHNAAPSDLMPELQGRFPIRVELSELTRDDFERILKEPQNSLTQQQQMLLSTEGLGVNFTDDGIAEIAQIAYDVNRRSQNIGARRLHTIMERVFEDISYDADEKRGMTVKVDGKYVKAKVAAGKDRFGM